MSHISQKNMLFTTISVHLTDLGRVLEYNIFCENVKYLKIKKSRQKYVFGNMFIWEGGGGRGMCDIM